MAIEDALATLHNRDYDSPMPQWIAAMLLSGALTQGVAALDSYNLEEAVGLLEQAQGEGPYSRADYIRLYEKLGIAHAYLEHDADSLAAFDMLLGLDPGHALSYAMSPKVTLLFEQARERARQRPPPTIDLSYPRDRRVDEAVPITIEVLADPQAFLKQATLFWRRQGAEGFERVPITLPPLGRYVAIELGPIAPEATADAAVQLYLVAMDASGNEVLQVGRPDHPRDLKVRYEPPTPWYKRWWIWAVAAGVVAAGVSTGVYFGTRSDPAKVPLRVAK